VDVIAPYQEVAAHIRDLIAAGDLAAGSTLPSQRELAVTLSVARGTVESAYALLLREGVIRKQWRGFVVVDPDRLRVAREKALVAEIRADLQRKLQMGYRADEVRAANALALLEFQ
jgi:DNA-binding transcriptional regulator YhcF (GntR family)